MKKHFIAMPVLFSIVGCSSTSSVKQQDTTFDNVVQVSGFTKEQIYVASKIWLAETFPSSESIIEVDSHEVGILIGNGNTPMTATNGRVKFTMRIDMKDDKFKTSFSNINLVWPASYSNYVRISSHDAPVSTQADMDKIKPKLLALSDDLKTAILQNKTDNNW